MYSSMPEKKMVSLARSLQTIHAIATELIPGEYPKHSLLRVVAFEDTDAFVAEFQTDEFIGFMQPSMRQHVLAFGMATNTTRPLQVAFHEYTHYVSRSRYDHFIPMWYEEGFAQYLGTVRTKSGHAQIGEVRVRNMLRAISRNQSKWETILDGVPRIDWHEHDYAAHYEFAHAVVHFMHRGFTGDGEPMKDKVRDILLAISNGRKSSEVLPEFAGVNPDEFMRTLRSHFRKTKPLSYAEEFNADHFSPIGDFKCLSELDGRKILAEALVRINPQRAYDHVERGLALDPDDPKLQVLLSYLPTLDSKSSFERTQQALELGPDNVDAHVRMGDLLSYNCLDVESAECDRLIFIASQHYRRALGSDPLRVDAAFGLGVSLLNSARAGDGLNYLRVAYRRVPWNARVNYFLGNAYMQIGNRREAVHHLNRAVLWEVEEALRNQAASLIETVN